MKNISSCIYSHHDLYVPHRTCFAFESSTKSPFFQFCIPTREHFYLHCNCSMHTTQSQQKDGKMITINSTKKTACITTFSLFNDANFSDIPLKTDFQEG